MRQRPRPLSIVKLLLSHPGSSSIMKLSNGEQEFVYLGEIPNMPEHCVVSSMKSGKVLAGLHSDNFEELSDDDI